MSIHSGQTILDSIEQIIQSRIKKKSRGIHHHYKHLINGYEAKIAELSQKIFQMTCLFSEPSDPVLAPVPELSERQLRDRELRENELREREQREREESEQLEQSERELREQREQRELEQREQRELVQREHRQREQRELEQREQRELEQREQRELEQREQRELEQREQRELEQREQRELEQRDQRELEQREHREREHREREQSEREQSEQREWEQSEFEREHPELEQRELEFIRELREFYKLEEQHRDQLEQNDIVLIRTPYTDWDALFKDQKEMQRSYPEPQPINLCDSAEPVMQRKPTKKKPKNHRRHNRK